MRSLRIPAGPGWPPRERNRKSPRQRTKEEGAPARPPACPGRGPSAGRCFSPGPAEAFLPGPQAFASPQRRVHYLARPEGAMAHSQVRKRSRSRSQSASRSRQDVQQQQQQQQKPRRKSSKGCRGHRSRSPAGKRAPESQRLRMGSASAKEVKKKKKGKKRRKASNTSSSSTSSSSETTSSSGSSSSPEDSSDGELKPKRRKQSKKKLTKEKDKKRKRRKRKARKKAKKQKLKEREGGEGEARGEELPGPSLDQWRKEMGADPGPALTDEQKSRIQAMKPMTKEEWDARQSVVRKVVDPETGRMRLIKGDGEILEEIVTKERHKEINKQATRGDGLSFQMRTGMLQ